MPSLWGIMRSEFCVLKPRSKEGLLLLMLFSIRDLTGKCDLLLVQLDKFSAIPEGLKNETEIAKRGF